MMQNNDLLLSNNIDEEGYLPTNNSNTNIANQLKEYKNTAGKSIIEVYKLKSIEK